MPTYFEIEQLPLKSPIYQDDYAILVGNDKKMYYIWDKLTFQEIFTIDCRDSDLLRVHQGHNAFFLCKKDKGVMYKYDSVTNTCSEHDYGGTLFHTTEQGIGYGIVDKKYVILDTDFKVINVFDKVKENSFLYTDHGIIDTTRFTHDTHFVRRYNIFTNELLWQLDFESHGLHHQFWERYLVMKVYTKKGHIVYCIDIVEGKILWSKNIVAIKIKIDAVKRCVVINAIFNEFMEISLESGDILNTFTLKSPILLDREPAHIRMLERERIFYSQSLRINMLGEMVRETGEIIWEEHFIPEGCDHLNLRFWTKAKNGTHLVKVFDHNNPQLFFMNIK